MGAIFGLVNLDGSPVESEDLDRMNAALAPHGRDGGGIWELGAVGLGNRLMRFTPQDCYEQQPLITPDRQSILVLDGRIDNRDEIATELGILRPPSETPDSALISNAYARWGSDCVRHLVGAFTFALWDAGRQSLIVVRSPIASPCLFYHVTSWALAFSTMPKGLFALPFVTRELDEQFLADYIAMEGTEPAASFYRGISRLLPGQMLVVRREGWEVKEYWQPDLKREIRFARDEDYVQAFDELFGRVIRDHLKSLTPVGVMMSGGFDSTTIAAIAAEILEREGKHLPTFTEVPRLDFEGAVGEGRYADETPYVQAMAREYSNIDLNLIHTDGQIYLEGLESFFRAAEVPFRNASNRVWYEAIMHAAEQSGVRVLLDGGQGNLTISWDGRGLLAQLVRARRWGRAWDESRALARRGVARSPVHALFGRGILPLLPDLLYSTVEGLRFRDGMAGRSETARRARSPIRPDYALAHHVQERARSRRKEFSFRSSADTRPLRFRTILGTTRSADGIDAGYQALYGVSGRGPTSDVRLVDFCLSLPEEQYQRDGQVRWLIRRAMAHRLPKEVAENRKRGLQAADWYERLVGNRTKILEELDRIGQSDLARRALDLDRLRRLVEQMPSADGMTDQLFADYRGVLELGLMTGCFIRWVESD